jgi:hypothetical protein
MSCDQQKVGQVIQIHGCSIFGTNRLVFACTVIFLSPYYPKSEQTPDEPHLWEESGMSQAAGRVRISPSLPRPWPSGRSVRVGKVI